MSVQLVKLELEEKERLSSGTQRIISVPWLCILTNLGQLQPRFSDHQVARIDDASI